MRIVSFIYEKITTRQQADFDQDVADAINGRIEFSSPSLYAQNGNIAGAWATGTTPAMVDTEFAVTHNLGRIPTGWIVFSINKAGIIYKGVSAWTNKQIFLKCNTASVAFIIFIT